jgi:hypothetical protein
MKTKSMKIIDQYLERVQVYLPIGSGDTLKEIRTHILEEAERLGEGIVTPGSIMLAIEHLGEPKAIANEYAGTGKTKGFIPVEYLTPLIRLLTVLIGASVAFAVISQIIGTALGAYLGEVTFFPFLLVLIVVVNLIFALVILTGITFLDQNTLPTEKTLLESFLGIGIEGFKPKPRTDAAGDLITGIVFGLLLYLPQIQVMFSPAFLSFVGLISIISFLSALKGTLFLTGGENNVNLLAEILLSTAWILFALLLVNLPWPIQNVWNLIDGQWTLINLGTFMAQIELPFPIFDFLWLFIILVTVTVSIWRIVVNGMKISTFLKQHKGWWWHGES